MVDKLHYISQQPENGSHLTAISQALQAGCQWIQLRVKDQPANVVLEYAIAAKKLCSQHGAKLIVNDYPEIALEVGAYGVHLGLQDMPVSQARKITGSKMIIGGTANTFRDIGQRLAEGVDYIGLGPYRFTHTKQKLSPVLGWEGIDEIMKKLAPVPVPIIAIGGVLPDDITVIMKTGVYGIAMSGAITYAENRAELVQRMYGQLTAFSSSSIPKL